MRRTKAKTRWMQSGEKCDSRRLARAVRVVAGISDSLVRQLVQIWAWRIWIPIGSQIVVAKIIEDDEQDVGSLVFDRRTRHGCDQQ